MNLPALRKRGRIIRSLIENLFQSNERGTRSQQEIKFSDEIFTSDVSTELVRELIKGFSRDILSLTLTVTIGGIKLPKMKLLRVVFLIDQN